MAGAASAGLEAYQQWTARPQVKRAAGAQPLIEVKTATETARASSPIRSEASTGVKASRKSN
jgi:hypothetical protein